MQKYSFGKDNHM